ncbi:MAG TPA: hypothetical protein VFJ30_07760, partial [Phycisphaerae bacterium]|nr:hypothetical protein [Phycisphaerae bacterium]
MKRNSGTAGLRGMALAAALICLTDCQAGRACEVSLAFDHPYVAESPSGDHSQVVGVSLSIAGEEPLSGTVTITQEAGGSGAVTFWKCTETGWEEIEGDPRFTVPDDFKPEGSGYVLKDGLHVQGTSESSALPGLSFKANWKDGEETLASSINPAKIAVFIVAVTTPASFPAYVPVSTPLPGGLDCTVTPPNIPGGSYQWTQVSGPGTVTFGTPTAKSTSFSADAPGTYAVKVAYTNGPTTAEATSGDIVVFSVGITTPASFPVYVAVNAQLPGGLDCTLSPPGIPGGTYQWTKESGPGNVTFGTPNAKSTTFSADAPGTYTVKVEYTKGGATASDTSGDIIVFSVAITTPGSFPVYVAINKELPGGLDCTVTPGGIPGGSYQWSKASGPGTVTFGTPTAMSTSFSADAPGTYTVKVQYTKDGTTASATSGDIIVFSVAITTPASFPAYVAVNQQLPGGLDCTLTPGTTGGTYQWTKVSGAGTVAFGTPTAKTTTFSADAAGTYTVKVEYTKDGTTASATSGDIIVFSVTITTPATFPAYVAKGGQLQGGLGCTVTPAGIPGGTYQWAKASGPGTVTFGTPTAHTTTFSADTDGTYTVQVQYSKDGTTASATSGALGVFTVTLTVENNLTECMEGRYCTYTATVTGTFPQSGIIDFVFHYTHADGTTWTSTDWSYDLVEDNTAVADQVPAGDADHKFTTPIWAEAKNSGVTGVSNTLNIDVYELWIDYFVGHADWTRPWKIVVGEAIDYGAIASSDCYNWDWDMEDGVPDVWNPGGTRNVKNGGWPTSHMWIGNADLPSDSDWNYFGQTYGTVTVRCEDGEDNNHTFYSTTIPQKAIVFFDPTLTTHPGGGSKNWFYYWKYALFGSTDNVAWNAAREYGV